jgi:hypothetical protein
VASPSGQFQEYACLLTYNKKVADYCLTDEDCVLVSKQRLRNIHEECNAFRSIFVDEGYEDVLSIYRDLCGG